MIILVIILAAVSILMYLLLVFSGDKDREDVERRSDLDKKS